MVYSLHPQQSMRHNYNILQMSFLLYIYAYAHIYKDICFLISVMIGIPHRKQPYYKGIRW